MRAPRPPVRRALRPSSLLVLLALLLRFALPTGFMISAEDGLAVVPCPSVLPVLAQASQDHDVAQGRHAHAGHQHHAPEPAEPAHDDRPCPYGVLVVPGMAPAEAPSMLEREPGLAEAPVLAPSAAVVRPLATPPPPSRGPPLLS